MSQLMMEPWQRAKERQLRPPQSMQKSHLNITCMTMCIIPIGGESLRHYLKLRIIMSQTKMQLGLLRLEILHADAKENNAINSLNTLKESRRTREPNRVAHVMLDKVAKVCLSYGGEGSKPLAYQCPMHAGQYLEHMLLQPINYPSKPQSSIMSLLCIHVT